MPSRKSISSGLRVETVAAHQFKRGYKIISQQFGVQHSTDRKIIHNLKVFKTVVNLLRSGRPIKLSPRSEGAPLLREIKNKTNKRRATSQSLQASLSICYMLNLVIN